MSLGMTFLGSLFCGVAVIAFLLTIYAHVEGNRLAATRFVFQDIRRDMQRHPLHRVWWRAFLIANGLQKRGSNHSSRLTVTYLHPDALGKHV